MMNASHYHTMVQNRKKNWEKIAIQSFTFPQAREWAKWASEQTSERSSKESSAEQANEWAVRANEQTDKRVAQYLRPDSWFFWTTERQSRGLMPILSPVL